MSGRFHRARRNIGLGIITVPAVVGLAAGVVGCGGSKHANAAGPLTGTSHAASATSSLKSVEFINPSEGQPTWQVISRCFADEAKAKGLSAKLVGTPGISSSTASNLNSIQQAIADNVGAIALGTFGGAAQLEPALAQAKAKGIKIITMDSGTATPIRTADVGIDVPAFSQDQVKQAAKLPGTKNVAFLAQSLSGAPLEFLNDAKAQLSKEPDMHLQTVVTDGGTVTDDANLIGSMLTAHPNVNVIIADNPGSTAGVVTAIREHGDVGKVHFIGNGIAQPAPAALASGAASAFAVQNVCALGRTVLDTMVRASQGKSVPQDIPDQLAYATRSHANFGPDWQ